MRCLAGFEPVDSSKVNISSTHKLTILHLQPERITAISSFFNTTPLCLRRTGPWKSHPPAFIVAGPRITEVLLWLWRIIAYTVAVRICVLLDLASSQMDSRLPPEEREGVAMQFSRCRRARDAFI